MTVTMPCFLAFLLFAAVDATRVWSVCQGIVPPLPSQEEMAADVMVGMLTKCSQEYTFDDLCDKDMAELLAEDLAEEGSMFLNAANRGQASPDGSMESNPECSAGSECYMVCTSESAVVELAEVSSDPPSTGSSGDNSATPEQVKASCSPFYFSKQQILDGELFDYRQEFLIAQGVDPSSGSLICPYHGDDPRYKSPESSGSGFMARTWSADAAPVPVSLRGSRGAGEVQRKDAKCTSMASLVNMSDLAILQKFPVIDFMLLDPTAHTMSHGRRVSNTFVVHHVQRDRHNQTLTLTSYIHQQLDIDAHTGMATLTHKAPNKRKHVFSGTATCIHNRPRATARMNGPTSSSSSFYEKSQKSGKLGSVLRTSSTSKRGGGFLSTSGSFTLSGSDAGGRL